MSLGNLSVKVGADISSYTSSMDTAASVARDKMGASAAAVNDFRSSLMRASSELEKAAQSMGGNMQAANDAIAASSAQSAEAIQNISDTADKSDFKSMGEKIASAIGVGIGAGIASTNKAWEAFVEYIKARVIIAAIAIVTGIAAIVVSAFYVAYKLVSGSIDLIAGLMDGTFYKSENVDALIASNNELKDLQKNLGLSSIEAGGLNDALKRLGVDKADYKTVYAGIAESAGKNGEELDRLGVKFKGMDGKILENRQTLENAKRVLDTYTAGWDRNQAAAAIGMGTYEQISAVLRVTAQETQKSKERLDEYQLGISAGAQEAIAKYETAMREFSVENDKFGAGIKRVIADAVMPQLTIMANWFQEGWPSMVRAFRVGVGSIAALFYAMSDAAHIAAEGIIAAFGIVYDLVKGVAVALFKAASGDMKGAWDALAGGWEGAKDRIKIAGENIMMQVMENDKNIKLAIAEDGRSASIKSAVIPTPQLKKWVAKPKEEKETMVKQDPFAAEMNNLGRTQAGIDYVIKNFEKFDGKVKESKVAMAEFDVTLGKFSDKQREQAGFDPLTATQKAAYIALNKLNEDGLELERQKMVIKKLDLGIANFAETNKMDIDSRRQDVEWMGKGQLALSKLTEARRIDGNVMKLISAAQIELGEKGEKIKQEQIAAIYAEADATKAAINELLQRSSDMQQSASFGAAEAMRQYGESAANTGAQIQNSLGNAFKSAEDAFVQFTLTGKLSFGDMAKSIMADIARIQMRKAIAGMINLAIGGFGGSDLKLDTAGAGMTSAGSTSLASQGLAGAYADGGDPPVGKPSLVGERGPEIFVPRGAGTIIPNSQIGKGSGDVYVTVNTTNGDSKTESKSDGRELVRLGNMIGAKVREVILQEKRNGGLLA
jgi:lambda family phage tail tape measure protein